jgi:hypothetical protein
MKTFTISPNTCIHIVCSTQSHKTPLALAVSHGRTTAVKELLSHLATLHNCEGRPLALSRAYQIAFQMSSSEEIRDLFRHKDVSPHTLLASSTHHKTAILDAFKGVHPSLAKDVRALHPSPTHTKFIALRAAHTGDYIRGIYHRLPPPR